MSGHHDQYRPSYPAYPVHRGAGSSHGYLQEQPGISYWNPQSRVDSDTIYWQNRALTAESSFTAVKQDVLAWRDRAMRVEDELTQAQSHLRDWRSWRTRARKAERRVMDLKRELDARKGMKSRGAGPGTEARGDSGGAAADAPTSKEPMIQQEQAAADAVDQAKQNRIWKGTWMDPTKTLSKRQRYKLDRARKPLKDRIIADREKVAEQGRNANGDRQARHNDLKTKAIAPGPKDVKMEEKQDNNVRAKLVQYAKMLDERPLARMEVVEDEAQHNEKDGVIILDI